MAYRCCIRQTEYVLGRTDLISQTRGGQNDYYLTDALGSVRLMTDGAGVVTNTYRYDAFGNLVAQTGSRENSYLYTGQQFDAATGLYSLRARYYDPGAGRFLSYDTWPIDIQNPLELNRYGYGMNNPVRWSDPSGCYLAADGLHITLLYPPALSISNTLVYTILGSVAVFVAMIVLFAKKSDLKQVDRAAREFGITGRWRKEFGKFVEQAKREYYGRDLTMDELLDLAEEFAEDHGLLEDDDESGEKEE